MFDLFKSKAKRSKERLGNELLGGALKVLAALNTQIDHLMFFEGKQKSNFLADAYFVRYAFGMIDAVTTLVGLELRSKLGMQFLAMHYLRYFIQEFDFDQTTALRLFQSVSRIYNTAEGQRDAAILDGGFDGVSVLRGGHANRLLKNFGVHNDDTPVTQVELDKFITQLPKWKEFCSRDRYSESAIREGQRVMEAVMKGDITI